jgi:hypothetical protein
MEEIVVTRLWMAGVVAAMLVFGIIALIGYRRQNSNSDAGDD